MTPPGPNPGLAAGTAPGLDAHSAETVPGTKASGGGIPVRGTRESSRESFPGFLCRLSEKFKGCIVGVDCLA